MKKIDSPYLKSRLVTEGERAKGGGGILLFSVSPEKTVGTFFFFVFMRRISMKMMWEECFVVSTITHSKKKIGCS